MLMSGNALAEIDTNLICQGQFILYGDNAGYTKASAFVRINKQNITISGVPFFDGKYNHGNFDTEAQMGMYKDDGLTMGTISRIDGSIDMNYPMGANIGQLKYSFKGNCKPGKTMF